MHTTDQHSHNTTLISLVLSTVLALVLVLATVTGAYAADNTPVTAFDAFTGTGTGVGSLVVPLANPPAGALTRVYQGSFGSFPSSGDPQALTVDQATGDVYAVSPSAGTVSRFTSAGVADNFIAGSDSGTNTLTGFSFDGPSAAEVAIAPVGAAGGTAGDIYVVSFAGVDIYANDGTHLGQITQANGSDFEESCGVATDNAGNLYVGDYGAKVDRYVPSANPVTNGDYDAQITGVSTPCNVAADSTGAVYASTWSTGPLTKHPATDFGTSTPGTLIDTSSRAVSLDPSSDDVYVDEGEKIAVFDSTGTPQYMFGSSADFGTSSAGVAVMGSGGNAYVADPSNKQIDVYGPAVAVPPTATTATASDIHHVKATLNGHLDPNDGAEITDCHFDWGATNAYGNTTPCTQGNNYTAPADVSTTIAGLEPGTAYHFRLVVSTGASTGTGADESFETVPLPVVHALTSTFGSSGHGDSQLSGDAGLAVNQTTGHVYVADTSDYRVEEFDSNGTFVSVFGWGVKDGKPEAQTCTTGCEAGIAGSGAGQLATPVFVAIDNSAGPSAGDVYVGDTTNNSVTKYDSSGNYISTNDGTSSGTSFGPLAGIAVSTKGDLWVYDTNADMREFAQNGTFTTTWNSGLGVTPAGIAVDSSETLYVVRGNPAVERLSSSGSDLGNVTGFPTEPTFNGPTTGLAIDPASGDLYVDDGGTHVRLYANPSACVEQGNQGHEGCTVLETFGSGDLTAANGVAVNGPSGRVYVSDPDSVKIFDRATPPDVRTGTATASSPTSATLNGTVGPNGLALTDCHFEYVTDAAFLATGFTDLSSGGSASCSPNSGSIPADLEDHAVTATITGLDPATIYHFRLVAANAETRANGQDAIVPGPPLVETTGSPTRTTTTARLDSRLDPRDAPTTYHFEYGDQGPCGTSPCTSTPTQQAGNGNTYELVSQQIVGLKANTTYHYRLIAENGIPGGAMDGQDRTLTTRTSDAPLTHGGFPGPPGSDRAWEQVSIPDADGNKVAPLSISDSGERALYSIDGGSPGSTYGGATFGESNDQLAERTPSGWKNKSLFPTRAQAPGNIWLGLWGSTELLDLYGLNYDETGVGTADLWRLKPNATPQQLLDKPGQYFKKLSSPVWFSASDDGSRMIAVLEGTNDPAYPLPERQSQLYDLGGGSPKLIGLLPGNTPPLCGTQMSEGVHVKPVYHWITPEGSHAFFYAIPDADCVTGRPALYDRDLANSTTKLIASRASFIRSAAGGVFFSTSENLASGDHPGSDDIYRYQIDDGSLSCLTCAIPGDSDVHAAYSRNNVSKVVVSNDGSRIYFIASQRLLPGAASRGIYRLDVAGGDLAYVAPAGNQVDISVVTTTGTAISPDGSIFVFRSNEPELNAIDGQQNGGTFQYYLFDDNDRSLVCTSCPPDGSAPRGAADRPSFAGSEYYLGSNGSALSREGDFVFSTPTPLVPVDQNTAAAGQDPSRGTDIYEWRDGRLLLVTDGKTEARGNASLEFAGMSPSGRDVFFNQAAALTPDAIDSASRLYDARIGGGFDFPPPPPPCSLEACQGTPLPPPDDATPSSLSFSGPGNQANRSVSPKQTKACVSGKCATHRKKRCAQGRVLKHGKCVKKVAPKRAGRANHNKGGAK
jgi:hypothetical protein